MRVLITALALCAFSFVVGVAGDLSLAPAAERGVAVTVEIPPNAIRAGPLPPIATPTASAAALIPARPEPVARVTPVARVAIAETRAPEAKSNPPPPRVTRKAKPERERKEAARATPPKAAA